MMFNVLRQQVIKVRVGQDMKRSVTSLFSSQTLHTGVQDPASYGVKFFNVYSKRWFASTIGNNSKHVIPSPKGPNDDPLSPEEELAEKHRVESLTSFEKEMELRELDQNIALLNTYRGINTGELYTFRGKFKALARDYGIGFMAWYWTCWCGTLGLTYATIDIGGFDALPLIAKVDGLFGTNAAHSIDPRLGNVAVSIAVNEILEPLRLPFVVMTTKPIVKLFNNR